MQHSMWGCFASKKVCRAVLTRSRLLAVNDISARLTDWVDSLGKDAVSACQALACLRGLHRPSGERLDVVLLLVMARQKPKLHFFARCAVPENEDKPFQDVIPDSFPFVASLLVGPSVISPAHSSVKIVTNETLAGELAEFDMAWKLHPLRWDFPDSHRLTDHVVTGLEAAFTPPQGQKRKASRVDPTSDIPDGDPLQLGEAAAAGRSGVDCPLLAPPRSDAGAPAAEFLGELPGLLDLDTEDLFFGLDRDAREVIASEWFGHEGCIDDSLMPEEEEAAAAREADDASDGSKDFDDPAACLEVHGDAAAGSAGSEGAGGGAAARESDDHAPAADTAEPSLHDFVCPGGCTLRDYAHQTIPGQSFWLARLPKGAPPFEGTKSKSLKYSNEDPAEQATAKAFCAAWLQRWAARGRGSGSGGSASSGGAGA